MRNSNLERSLDVQRSVFIQACAGAGKTFSLAKRYAAILDRFAAEAREGVDAQDIDPARILVITFTTKAAGEMASRIGRDISDLLSGREIPEMRAQGLDFCPVLRKDPHPAVRTYAAYLKAHFSQHAIMTIDAFCARVLREFAHRADLDPEFGVQEEADAAQLLEGFLDGWIKAKAEAGDRELLELLEKVEGERIRRMLTGIYRHRELLQEHLAQFATRSDAEIWRDWLERYTPAYDEDVVTGGFLSLYKQADALCKDPEDAFYKTLQEMYAQYRSLPAKDPAERRAAFLSRVIRGALLTTKYEYRKNPPGSKANWRDKRTAAESWFEDLKAQIPVGDLLAVPGPEDRRIIPLLRRLFVLYRSFDRDYLALRKNRNTLDFSDVILFTHRLFREHPDVRRKLSRRYRHIMVDEFQDTNPLRWDIIKSLFRSGDDSDRDEPVRLFIVGDRKQSIYRFNNADVTVMNDAEELIRSQGGEILDFNDNFRSTKDFIENGINRIFGEAGILPPKERPRKAYEAFFEPTGYRGKAQDRVAGALEFHWCRQEDDDGTGYLPARHAAQRVRDLLRELRERDVKTEPGKPLVGVLLRKFTHIGEYLQAFRMLDIPVSIVGGKGFYQSPAARDAGNFLAVLDNPRDDLALAGLLRSPLMALPDTEIHLLAERGSGTSLLEAMRDSGRPLLKAAAAEITQWRERSRELSPDLLLTRILEEKDAELGYAAELMPRQRLANLDKAVNIIGGLARQGRDLRSIREYFHYRIQHNTNEAQAQYPEQAEVHILTVHKAKGLQFPAVVIPEMNAGTGSDRDSFRFGHRDGYPEVSLSLPGPEHSGILYGLKKNAEEEEAAEEKRVFYVAVTRAVHKVLFLGEEKKRTDKNGWWNLFVRPVCGIEEKADAGTLKEKGVRVHEARECCGEATSSPAVQSVAWTEKADFPEPGRWRYCTPHDLMDGGETARISGGSGEGGLALGSCFHWCIEEGCFDPDTCREALAQRLLDSYPGTDPREVLKTCRSLLAGLKEHELYGILRDPAIEKYHELPLTGWLMRDRDVLQVNGKVDLLFRRKDRWVVVDFKTDRGRENLPRYERQIRSYQWMLRQAFGIEAEGRLYFARGSAYVQVEEDGAYFDTLPAGKGYRPQLPPSGADTDVPLPPAAGAGRLLFCPSSFYASRVYLSLVRRGRMHPSIRIGTFGARLMNSRVRTMSRDRLRLLILSGEGEVRRGFAELMASAVLEHERGMGTLLPEFSAAYARLCRIRQEAGFASADEVYRDPRLSDIPAGTQVVFMDLPPLPPLQEDLRKRIAARSESVSLSLLHDASAEGPPACIRAFSPREEVIAVAQEIASSGLAPEEVCISVSSMDKYAALIDRIFPQFGLAPRFIESPSADRHPAVTLLQEFLRVLGMERPQWPDLAPLLLHPLCRPGKDLLKADLEYRAGPGEEFDLPPAAKAFLERYSPSGKADLAELTEAFIRDTELTAAAGGETRSAVETFRRVLAEVLRDLELPFCKKDPGLVCAELQTRLRKAQARRKDHKNGIPVVGFLDSAGLPVTRLFVMGMVEGDIPRSGNGNPYLHLPPGESYSLELNRYFMQKWLALGQKVTFSYPRHAEDGTEQQMSVFLKDTGVQVRNAPRNGGRREQILQYANRRIDADHTAARRHNEIVRREAGIFSGKVNARRRHFDMSVSAVETLLACPMRFYFERILKLRPADAEEAVLRTLKKGNVIHRVLEEFGVRGGFDLSEAEGLTLLRRTLDTVLRKENLDPADPLVRDLFRYHIRNLELGNRENCLVSLLHWNAEDLRDYRAEEFEWAFNESKHKALCLETEGVTVDIRGKIDKIMRHRREPHLLVSDYKTGAVPPKWEFNEYLRAQLILYVMKAKEAYPGLTAEAAYEQIKIPSHLGNGGTDLHRFREEDGRFGKLKRNGELNDYADLREFRRVLDKLFSHISRGEYYITDRPFDKACKHCPYEGLCRRDSRYRPPALIHDEEGEDDE